MPTSANFTAFGFQKVERSFSDIFGIEPGASISSRLSVPGAFMNPATTRYLAIAFVMNDDAGGDASQMELPWIDGNLDFGAPGGAITVTVSPCPGDFRPPALGTGDAYLSGACRVDGPYSLHGGLTITSSSALGGCPAPKGKQMYINVATYNMYGPSAPSAMTCGSGSTYCGAAMTVR
jgi:hypothetical protein